MASVLMLQRVPQLPIAKHAAALFGKAAGKIWAWRVAMPAMAGAGSYHSLTGASPSVVSDDPNPASGVSGDSFSFGFYTIIKEAETYSFQGMPSGLSFNNSKFSPLITGTLPAPGTYEIFITAWENSNFTGDSTAPYKLTINVSGANNAPVLSSIPTQDTVEATLVTVSLSATDLDGDNITYSATSDTLMVTTSVSGNELTLTTNTGWNGTANITVTASDGNGGTDTTSFELQVNPPLGLWMDSNTTLLGGNWKTSNWFGTFYDNSNSWLYHQHHSWMYTSGTDEAGMWVYDTDLGWLFTGKNGIYPYMYRSSTSTWLYFDANSG